MYILFQEALASTTPANVAVVTNYARDSKGRIHGTVRLSMPREQVKLLESIIFS